MLPRFTILPNPGICALILMASLVPHTGNFIGEEGLLFLGFAYAYIFDDRTGIVDTDFSACVFEMKFLPPEQKEIEAWIIIAAAASALLFLSCLIFGLCKVNLMQCSVPVFRGREAWGF